MLKVPQQILHVQLGSSIINLIELILRRKCSVVICPLFSCMLQMLQKIKVEKQIAPYLFKIYNYIFKMLSQKGVIHIQKDPR